MFDGVVLCCALSAFGETNRTLCCVFAQAILLFRFSAAGFEDYVQWLRCLQQSLSTEYLCRFCWRFFFLRMFACCFLPVCEQLYVMHLSKIQEPWQTLAVFNSQRMGLRSFFCLASTCLLNRKVCCYFLILIGGCCHGVQQQAMSKVIRACPFFEKSHFKCRCEFEHIQHIVAMRQSAVKLSSGLCTSAYACCGAFASA